MLITLIIVLIVGPFCAVTAYIVVTAAKRVRDAGRWDSISWWVAAVVMFWFVVGFPFDVLLNATYAWWRFKERPRELTLTSRLKRYRNYPDGDWQKRRAIKGWTWLNFFERGHW